MLQKATAINIYYDTSLKIFIVKGETPIEINPIHIVSMCSETINIHEELIVNSEIKPFFTWKRTTREYVYTGTVETYTYTLVNGKEFTTFTPLKIQ